MSNEHDWCADANCETCSHRHKAESQSMNRPNPAVGQVWRDTFGIDYLLMCEVDYTNGPCFGIVACISGVFREITRVQETDTYVGQFAGFKVQEEGGK